MKTVLSVLAFAAAALTAVQASAADSPRLRGPQAKVIRPAVHEFPLRVRTEDSDHILTSDACYFCDVVRSRSFPAFSDKAAMNQALDGLLGLMEPDTVMVFGHDPDQWGEAPVLPTRRA